jgi:hypothetical protein
VVNRYYFWARIFLEKWLFLIRWTDPRVHSKKKSFL